MVLCDVGELLRHHLRRSAADSRVNLIEDQSGDIVGVRKHGLDSQHDSRQLAAGGHHAQRLYTLSRVRGDHELRCVKSAGGKVA